MSFSMQIQLYSVKLTWETLKRGTLSKLMDQEVKSLNDSAVQPKKGKLIALAVALLFFYRLKLSLRLRPHLTVRFNQHPGNKT